jgi:hypothetical protein
MLYLSPLTLRRACSASLVVGHMTGTECPLSRYVWRTKPLFRSFTVYRCSDFHPLFARTGCNSGAGATSLMNLYIHLLYILVIKILSSISNSPALIYPIYHPLSTVGPTCHFI